MTADTEPTPPEPEASAAPEARLERALRALYGSGADADVARDGIVGLLGRDAGGAHRPVPAGRRDWTERDAILATYADQVRAPGEAPLRTLRRFLRRRVKGLVDAVHVLPPFP